MSETASIKPSEMVEGGAVPVDQNLQVKEARFVLFDYQGKAPPTTSARLVLVNDEGVEYTQHYSAADPTRFVPSQDGKGLVAVGTGQALSKSSNFFILMNNLVSAGFPENKLGNDISVLANLYAYWIGVPEPKRTGLARTAEQTERERVILCPSQIHNLPWEKKTAKPGKPTSQPTSQPGAEQPQASDVSAATIEFISSVVGEAGSISRQDLAVRVFKDLADNPDRDAIATLVFSPEIQALLLANGFKVDGETISKGA